MILKMIFCIIFGVILVSVNGIRIAGGDPALVSEYPFSVALLTNAGQGSYIQACGGTLLTNSAVLSAASCFYTNQEADPANWWRARVGSNSGNSGGTIYIIRSINTNPGFSATTLANNIAVVRTTLNVALSPGSVEVARLAGAAFTFSTNQVLTAIGYGATSNQDQSSSADFRKVEVFVADQQICADRYSDLGITVTSDMVCAGWIDVGSRGQCQGDIGSPLLSNQAVVAVASRTQGCPDIMYPPLNTRIAPYLSWVIAAATARDI